MTHSVSRRGFIEKGLSGALALGAIVASGPLETDAQTQQNRRRRPPLTPETVGKFVRIAHKDLDEVKTMLEAEPALANATWDWGGGDWETALGGASHMGRRDIALYLLSNGARKDIFCAAMLGETEILKASVTVDPGVAKLRGPHRIPLFFHAALGGKVEIAKLLHAHGGGMGYERCMHGATEFGHTEMVAWLLANGVKDVNKQRGKKTALDVAIEKGHDEIAALLRKHGGKTAS